MDILQVVVHTQIKKTAQCTANKSMHKDHLQTHTTHHCLSNHQKHKIILCSLVGVGQTSLLITRATVDRCYSFKSACSFNIFNLIVINNNLFAMVLNEDTYKLLIVANRCKLFINCFLVPVPAPKAATV